jgi:hypothetical protein
MITPADLLNPEQYHSGRASDVGNGFRPHTLLGHRELIRAVADKGGDESIQVAGSKACSCDRLPRGRCRARQATVGGTRTLGAFTSQRSYSSCTTSRRQRIVGHCPTGSRIARKTENLRYNATMVPSRQPIGSEDGLQ